MKVRRVNRYYCEYCKKSGCSKFQIEQHEKHCTMNPNRRCRMCEKIANGDDEAVTCPKCLKKMRDLPITCPECGCQVYDPFGGTIKMHDVETCGGLIDISRGGNHA